MTKDKPAIFATAAVVAGIILARYASVSWIVWTGCAGICFILSILFFILHRKNSARDLSFGLLPLIALGFAASSSYSLNQQVKKNTHITRFLDTSDSLTIVCKVVDEPVMKDGKQKALVDVMSLRDGNDSVQVEGRAYLTIHPDKRLKETSRPVFYGTIITCTSILQTPIDTRNPGEFSYKNYLALNDVYATISVFGYSNLHLSKERETNFFFEHLVFPAKDFVERTITQTMKGDEAYFLIGLLLGDRTGVSTEIKNAFMNTGTIHVLAVSGTHVGLVVASVFMIFGLLRFPRKPKIIATILALIFYAFLTGAASSVVRASLMASILLLAKIFEERVNVYNTLGVAAVILLLFDPKQLFDVGFQLSFSAVFSIVYFYPKLNVLISKIPQSLEEFKIVKWLWQAFAVSFSAQIGTIPFTALYFGKVSLISFIANLFVVPLVGILVTIGLSGVLLGIISSFVSSCFLEVNQYIAWFTLALVKLAAKVPYATINASTFGWRETVFYSIGISFVFTLKNRVIQKRIVFAAFISAIFFIYFSLIDEGEHLLRITFLDVGQGDAAVLQFPTGETLVVDGGPNSSGVNAGEKIVSPFLQSHGISAINGIITTHPHDDHLGGIPYLLTHFTVDTVIDQGQKASSRLYMEYDSLRKNNLCKIIKAGLPLLNIPNARLYVLHPTDRFIDTDSSDGYTDLNESSIVFKLVYGRTSFLLTGDAEIPNEEQMMNVYGDFLDCDVLKAGHHGSITSSSAEFDSIVSPKEVVVSVGKFNKFRHPSMLVLERFRKNGVVIHRTDEEGAVIFESDGNKITRVPWKIDHGY